MSSNQKDTDDVKHEMPDGDAEIKSSDDERSDEHIIGADDAISDCSEQIQAAEMWEQKYKRALADYRNLERRTSMNIQDGIDQATDKIMLGFLDIYDDFVRARDAYAASGSRTEGLDSVLKNADSLLKRMDITPHEPLGDIFDPHKQHAIQSKVDPNLEEQTVTAVLRKGYIVNDRVLRPALVEVSTKEGT